MESHEQEIRMCWSLCVYVLSHVQLFCDPMDHSPPGSSAHGVFQARILEWVAIFYSTGPSWPRDWTQVSCIIPPVWENLTQQNHQILVLESISFNLLPKHGSLGISWKTWDWRTIVVTSISKSLSRNVPSALPWPLSVPFHSLWPHSVTCPPPPPSAKPGVVLTFLFHCFVKSGPASSGGLGEVPVVSPAVSVGAGTDPRGCPTDVSCWGSLLPSVPLIMFR